MRLAPALTTTLLASLLSAQSTLVVPTVAQNADGNSSTSWPFDVATMRIQYIYDSTHFTGNGVNFPILINQIRYRANGANTTWSGSTGTLQMSLSTAPIDHSVITNTFTSNHGVDELTVYNGALNLNGGTATTGTPGPFYATVTFTTPFLYDPSAGDLTIDTTHSGITIANTPALDCVTTAGVALARRMQTTTIANATGTIWTGELANVLEFTYTPASGLYANFTANVTTGASPLAVNFTDQSFSSSPGGVTSWAWDFNGDNVIDSNLQNPSFVYNTCGTYDVTLTVTDASHAPSTLTRTAYIRTDLITADFTAQVIGPLTMQFNDTSSMPATTWAWDLDGDLIVDSNLQNPVWVYANANPVNVTLTVTRLCSPTSTITKSIVPLQLISHNVAPNNGLSTGASVYFDLDVTNPTGINVSAMDVFGSVINVPFIVEMSVKPGSYLGAEGTAAEWVSAGTASGISAATTTTPSNVTFPQVVYLPPGQYGVKLQYIGTGPRYQTGTVLQTVSNGDLSLTVGASRGTTVALPWGGSNITPRWWSGTIYYGTHNVTGGAGYGSFAPGCPGSLGVSHLSANLPQLGGTLNVNLNNLPASLAILIVGFSNTASIFGPLPFDVTPYGAPGCFGRVSTDATLFLVGAGNTATWSFSIPSALAMSGLQLFNQALVLDAGFNGLGAVFSDATGMILGL